MRQSKEAKGAKSIGACRLATLFVLGQSYCSIGVEERDGMHLRGNFEEKIGRKKTWDLKIPSKLLSSLAGHSMRISPILIPRL